MSQFWEFLDHFSALSSVLGFPVLIAALIAMYKTKDATVKTTLVTTLLVIASLLYLIDVSDRFGWIKQEHKALVQSYGSLNGGFDMQINSREIASYSEKYNVFLFVLIESAGKDIQTDRNIIKSNAYSITGDTINLEIPVVKMQPYVGLRSVDFYAVVLPKGTDIDDVQSLSDVSLRGGKIVATKGTISEFVPARQL